MLDSHSRQIDITAMELARKKNGTTKRRLNRKAALGRPAIKLWGVGASFSLRSTNLALSSALVPQTLSCLVCVEDS